MKKIEVIKTAKGFYLDFINKNQFVGMCYCMKIATGYPGIRYRKIIENIPEFTPNKMQAGKEFQFPGLNFWWELGDVKSRLNAFNTLINLYKDNEEEFVIE